MQLRPAPSWIDRERTAACLPGQSCAEARGTLDLLARADKHGDGPRGQTGPPCALREGRAGEWQMSEITVAVHIGGVARSWPFAEVRAGSSRARRTLSIEGSGDRLGGGAHPAAAGSRWAIMRRRSHERQARRWSLTQIQSSVHPEFIGSAVAAVVVEQPYQDCARLRCPCVGHRSDHGAMAFTGRRRQRESDLGRFGSYAHQRVQGAVRLTAPCRWRQARFGRSPHSKGGAAHGRGGQWHYLGTALTNCPSYRR